MKRHMDAERCYTEALAISRKISRGSASVIEAQTHQCVNYNDMKEYVNADKCYIEASAMSENSLKLLPV